MNPQNFVGTWKLVEQKHIYKDGTVWYPMGEKAIGQLIYSADGYMSGILCRPDRPRFVSQELYGGLDSELLAAATGFVSYAGRYRIDGNKVIHTVEISFFPNWIGTDQVRYFELKEGKLTLATREFEAQGKAQKAYLLWEKKSDAKA